MILAHLIEQAHTTQDGLILIGFDKITHWPKLQLETLLKHHIIERSKPAQSLVCSGCEEACCRPVHLFPGMDRAFIVCDLRSDTSQVQVKLEQLQQWQLSLRAIYQLLSEQTGLNSSLLRSLPISWQRVFLIDAPCLTIDTDYLHELSLKMHPVNLAPINNSFVLSGDYWKITFNQKTVMIKDTKGIQYINYLIRIKGKSIHVSELYYAINPKDTTQTDDTLSSMTEEQLNTEGFSLSNLDNRFELLDKAAITSLKRHIEQLNDQIEEATEFGEFEALEKLETEKDQIIARLSSDMGLAGKSRLSSSPIENIRKNIERRISEDTRKLQNSFPEFASHLKTALKTGTVCQYTTFPDVFWEDIEQI